MIYEITDNKTLTAFMDLVRDGSPASGTHWSRCRGGQRIFANSWLTSFDAKRKARSQARRTQAAIYCAVAILTVYTIFAIKAVWK